MARFYSGCQGNRSQATRLGHESSGAHAFAQGWEIGGKVRVFAGPDGKDRVQFVLTSGSNGRHSERVIATYEAADFGQTQLGARQITNGVSS